MNGKKARAIRKAAGGQEINTERKYGYSTVEKDQKSRSYDIEDTEEQKKEGELVINPKTNKRNYKVSPIKLMSEGRRRVKALKKHFREASTGAM